jgi:acyl-CoA hydrolase
VDVATAAVDTARVVIAQVNPKMPRTLGHGLVHVSKLTAAVDVDVELPQSHLSVPGPVEDAIGRRVAELVEDGATLQMGIGGIPDAVLRSLGSHRRLGVHTEMFTDGLLPLVEKGVITGEHKKVQRRKIVSSFVMGSRALFDFIHDNPSVELRDTAYVNDTSVIRQNPKVTAINSALEVDLTGQVCADSLGDAIYSGVGGQIDFIRGASLSEGGKPIIALSSTTGSGISRIVPHLKPGAGVVSTRANVHYIITEHGTVNLYGLDLKARAHALIGIAAPQHRESLSAAAFARFGS